MFQILYFLSLGEKFYADPYESEIIEKISTAVEEKINLIPSDNGNVFRCKFSGGLHNFLNSNSNIIINSNINSIGNYTKLFFLNNTNIVVCKADKGNVTVIWDKQECIDQCLILWNDEKVHENLNKDPTQTTQKSWHTVT